MASWPIRRKLVALVIVPVLVIIGSGGLLTASSVAGLRQAQRARTLATTALATNIAVVALDNELAQTITYLQSFAGQKAGATGAELAMKQQRTISDEALRSLQSYLDRPPAGGWSTTVLGASTSVPVAQTRINGIRHSVTASFPTLQIDKNFQLNVIGPLRDLTTALSRDIATATANGRTVDESATLNALSSASAAATNERILGTIALDAKRLSKSDLEDLTTAALAQDVQLNIALGHATTPQRADIEALRSDDARIAGFRKDLTRLADGTLTLADPAAFSSATGQRLKGIDSLVGRVAQNTRDLSDNDVRSALLRTVLILGLGLVTLLLVFAALAAIARTVTGPMRRLRSGAVEVATIRLPAAVRQIEQQGVDANIDLPPLMPAGTAAGPETLEVAHAVDGLTAEAVRLATAQVRLRHALDEAFVSMSRRSQSMVEKQLAIIDELESTEEDPEQLRNLFRLDHLAARMRRYNDNLLVLAGSSVRTRSTTPVPVSDVFRAATSEMEQYERVRLQPVSSAALSGPVAGGLIHLLAELLDNAAMYSPPTSPILLTAAFTPDGGLHLEVTDSGVGIPPTELAELNSRLATPGSIDTQIPSRMGLFVVGRLAYRGGFEVRLSPRPTGAGTIAEVLVPAQHVVGAPGSTQEAPRLPAQLPPIPQRPATLPAPAPPVQLPSLPRRQTAPWPAAEDVPDGRPRPSVPPSPVAPAVSSGPAMPPMPPAPFAPPAPQAPAAPATPAASSGGPDAGLPSRVPGAALSSGPLSAGSAAENLAAQLEPFDAFGSTTFEAPPAPEPTTGSTATAMWSPQARAARSDSSMTGDLNLPMRSPGSFGFDPTSDYAEGRFGPTGMNGGTSTAEPDLRADEPPTGTGWPLRAQQPNPGNGWTGAGLPRRAVPGGAPQPPRQDESLHDELSRLDGLSRQDDLPGHEQLSRQDQTHQNDQATEPPFPSRAAQPPPHSPAPPAPMTGSGLPRRTPPASSRLFGSLSRTDTGGFMLPVEKVAPLTGEVSLRDLLKPGGPNLTLPPPSEPQVEPSAPDLFGAVPAAQPTLSEIEASALTEMEEAARSAAATRYRPADPNAPMIGNLDDLSPESATTPIFDSISLWFNDDAVPATAAATTVEPVGPPAQEGERLIDLRDDRAPTATVIPAGSVPAAASLASRWASLGDQQWLATSARAAAGPEIAGESDAGLPKRRPGANLLPSATSAAAPTPPPSTGPVHRADADTVRGRLSSYQRGVASARRSRQIPTGGTAAGLFTAERTTGEETGHEAEDLGGQQ